MAPLVKLTVLSLYDTSLGGDAAAGAPLVNLTCSTSTPASRRCGVAPLVNLTDFRLYNTSFGGDVSGVAPLVNLTVLSFDTMLEET